MPASRLGAVVLWLAAAFCCGVAVFPPLWAAVLSLTPADRVGGTLRISAWTLENYADVFAQPTFWRALLNSFLAALGTTLAALGLGIPAAYALTRVTDRLAGASLVILAVRMVPGIVLVLPFYMTYRQLRLLDTIPGLCLTYLTFALPFAIWMVSSFFAAIPKEIEEAAAIGGASRWTILWRILTPIAMPAILTTGVLVFIFCWNEFLFALILTSKNALTFLPLLLRYVLPQGPLYGQIFAGSTIFLVPPLIAFLLIRGKLSEAFGVGTGR